MSPGGASHLETGGRDVRGGLTDVPPEDGTRVGNDRPADGRLANDRLASDCLPKETVEQLYNEHAAGLTALLWGILHNRDTVSEVVQATFAKALEQGGQVDPQKYKAWLYQVGVNAAIQIKRREVTGRKALEQAAHENPGLFPLDDQPGNAEQIPHNRIDAEDGSGEDGPLAGLIREETIERVQAALTQLPPEQQQVVRRKLMDGNTFREVALELNLAEGTVVTRLRLALERLRQALNR